MRRRVVVVAVFLVLGAVLNLAVAWGGAAASDFGTGEVLELYAGLGDARHWEVYRWERFLGTRILSRTWRGPAPADANDGDPAELLSGWGEIRPPAAATAEDATQIDEAWGFPARTLSCRSDSAHDRGRMSGVIRLGGGSGDVTCLPAQPIWPGVALNTVCYGLVSMVAFGAGRDASRALRSKTAAE